MLVFVLILVAIICSGLTVAKKNEFYEDYCSPKNTNTINAIFSILIFLSHAASYLKLDGALDMPYLDFRAFHSQLVVVTFLFFSGFGIMESIKKKGITYVKEMPFKRLFRLWYHFAIVILLFTVVTVGIASKSFPLSQWLLSFTGIKSLGNSNWYMFVTFMMYIIVIVSFLLFRKHKVLALVSVFVLSFCMVIVEKKLGMSTTFYNTLICFPLGMAFSMLKPYLDKILMKNDVVWFIAFFMSVLVFAYFSRNRSQGLLFYEVFVITSLAVIVLFMMKVNINSSVLDWFGNHVFSFFILQRIPMILLSHFGYVNDSKLFVILSFFATVALAIVFDEAMAKLDSVVFKKRIK